MELETLTCRRDPWRYPAGRSLTRRVNLRRHASVATAEQSSKTAPLNTTPIHQDNAVAVKMSVEEDQTQYDELAGGPGAPTPLQQLEVSRRGSHCSEHQS